MVIIGGDQKAKLVFVTTTTIEVDGQRSHRFTTIILRQIQTGG